jgi:hypothetical protein
VVEAKAIYSHPSDGLQQAKEYAQILGLKFAYATNGRGIVEREFLTRREADLDGFPSADQLWGRLRVGEGIDEKAAERVLAPYYHLSGKSPAATTRRSRSIGRCKAFYRQTAHSSDAGNRHRQDGHCLSNLLQAVEFALESGGRTPASAHFVPGGPKRARG